MTSRSERVVVSPGGRAPVTVLVVEDDEDLRELLVDTLQRDGYFVLAAASVIDATLLLGRIDFDWRVDLVLSDVRMAGPSGIELARALHERNKELPLILMTAFPETAVHQEASTMGAGLLAKPFKLEVLRREVLTRIAEYVKSVDQTRRLAH